MQDNNQKVTRLWSPVKISMVFDNLKVFINSPLLFVQKTNYPAFEVYIFRNVSKHRIILHNIFLHLYAFKWENTMYNYKLENYLLLKNGTIRLIIIYTFISDDEFILDYNKDIIIYSRELGIQNISQNEVGIKIMDKTNYGFELFGSEQNAIGIRDNWTLHDTIEVKSESEWFVGCIKKIFFDETGEWLEVHYNNFNKKNVQRYSNEIRPLTDPNLSISKPKDQVTS